MKDDSGTAIKRKLEFSEGTCNEETTDSTSKAEPQEEKIDTSAKAVDQLIPNTPPAIVILNSVDENYLGQILAQNDESV